MCIQRFGINDVFAESDLTLLTMTNQVNRLHAASLSQHSRDLLDRIGVVRQQNDFGCRSNGSGNGVQVFQVSIDKSDRRWLGTNACLIRSCFGVLSWNRLRWRRDRCCNITSKHQTLFECIDFPARVFAKCYRIFVASNHDPRDSKRYVFVSALNLVLVQFNSIVFRQGMTTKR